MTPTPTPTSSPWSICSKAQSQLFFVSTSMKDFVVLSGKKKVSKLFDKLRWFVCVCMRIWLTVCERACIDGCVYVLERDRIPFVLGVNPLRLLWRFLKTGISWGHGWGWGSGDNFFPFPALGPDPPSFWSEAACDFSTEDKLYAYNKV